MLVPTLLGVAYLIAGILCYRREFAASASAGVFGLAAVGPVFVASALAAFAGEHFTAAASLAQIVPKWLPDRVFIAYFVGVAHLAAATSFITRRYIRWSAICLFMMFSLFVLLMDLPGAVAHPGVRIAWSLAARETTFAIGALALWLSDSARRAGDASPELGVIIRLWTAGVLVFYGIEHFVAPQFAPGVPDVTPTAGWVPAPHLIAYVVGLLLIAFGASMFVERYASAAAAWGGGLMLLLTLVLYVPQYFLAHTVPAGVEALNFVFDTMLFGGTLLVISGMIVPTRSPAPVATVMLVS